MTDQALRILRLLIAAWKSRDHPVWTQAAADLEAVLMFITNRLRRR